MNPYSKDRVRVLGAVDRGEPRAEVVWVFGASPGKTSNRYRTEDPVRCLHPVLCPQWQLPRHRA